MKPRLSHRNVVAQRTARLPDGVAAEKDLAAQQHLEYWEGQLDLLNSTVNARHRLLRIESTGEGDGISLHWRTGHFTRAELVVLGVGGVAIALIAGLASQNRAQVMAVSVVILILGAVWVLATAPKTHRLFLRQGDSAVEWVLNVFSVQEKGKERRSILTELARHPEIETERHTSIAARMWGSVRRGA